MSHSSDNGEQPEEYVGRRYARTPPPLYPPSTRPPSGDQRWAPGNRPAPPLAGSRTNTTSRGRSVFWVVLVVGAGLLLSNFMNSRMMDFVSSSPSLPTFSPREFSTPSPPGSTPIPGLAGGDPALTRLEPGVRIAVEDDVGVVGTIRLLEVRHDVDCGDEPVLDADEMVVGIRLSVISLAQTDPLPISAAQALALDGAGEQVDISPLPGCHADEIQEVVATGQPHEGWVTVRVDRSAETIAWEYAGSGDLVVVEIGGTSGS